MNLLWTEVQKDSTPGTFPSSFKLGTILFENLKVSFTETGDVFPKGREKLIHSVGAIAKATWTPVSNKYTGIFQGCSNLLVRLSLAKQPDYTKVKADQAYDNFVPGMAIKCLRTGVYSGNLQAMFSTAGQTSWNFFKHPFSHLISFPDETKITFAETAVAGKFSDVTPFVGNVGLKDLAQTGEDGKAAAAANYPFQIIFTPNPSIQSKFTDDFQASYMDQIKALPPGLLYDIYAIDKPGCAQKKIGSITTTTAFVSSKFSDNTLFFKHNSAEDDNAGHDDWKNYKDKVSFHLFGGLKVERALDFPKSVSGCPVLRLLKKIRKLF